MNEDLHADAKPFAYKEVRNSDNVPIYLPTKVPSDGRFCEFCYHMIELISLPQTSRERYPCIYFLEKYEFGDIERCDLCKLITKHKPENPIGALQDDKQIVLWVTKQERRGTDGEFFCCTCHLYATSYRTRYVSFAIWAQQDSPAAAQITTQPPIIACDANEIIRHTKHWLDTCILKDPECRQEPNHQEKELEEDGLGIPTRIIEISGDLECPRVKLVECFGRMGTYCTLSHCWGPSEKRPPRTTMENLNDRLQNISFHELPKTFREAIVLTLGIGISYLWIDSLCIIQDSEEDWRHESKHMGAIYKRATLMIAAAGSNDCTEGLFPHERSTTNPLKLPYIVNGIQNGKFYATSTPPVLKEDKLSESPLRQRAWAFQEWYLSRRRLFCTKSTLQWACTVHSMDEYSGGEDLELYESNSWLSLLGQYSSKLLTFPNDRLPALEGIVGESKRKGRWVFGTWDSSVTEQILWIRLDKRSTERLKLPSWSWAASAGEKSFLCCYMHTSDPLSILHEDITIHSSGQLNTKGKLLTGVMGTRKSCTECFSWFNSFEGVEPDGSILPEFYGLNDDSLNTNYMIDHTRAGIIVGLAVFDTDEIHYRWEIFIVCKTERSEESPLRPQIWAKSDYNSSFIMEGPNCDYDASFGEHEETNLQHEGEQKRGYSDLSTFKSMRRSHLGDRLENSCCSFTDQLADAEDLDKYGLDHRLTIREVPPVEGSEIKRNRHHSEEEPNQKQKTVRYRQDGAQETQEVQSCGFDIEYDHPHSDNCADNFDFALSEYVYFALILERVPDAENTFKRIGLAVLYPSAEPLFLNQPNTDIVLV